MIIYIFLFNLLMAVTFTFSKAALWYMSPIMLMCARFLIGGLVLFFYHYFTNNLPKIKKSDVKELALLIFIAFYLSFVFDNWGLQFVNSSESSLIYNLTPLSTALIGFFIFKETISLLQSLTLFFGFASLWPILEFDFESVDLINVFEITLYARLAILLSVFFGAYGWLLMQRLILEKKYSPLHLNMIGLLGAGCLSLFQIAVQKVSPYQQPFFKLDPSYMNDQVYLFFNYFFSVDNSIAITAMFHIVILIVITHVIGYPLYGYLLKRYSATFLALSGCTIPLISAFAGKFFLKEQLPSGFWVSFLMMSICVLLFYYEEEKRTGKGF